MFISKFPTCILPKKSVAIMVGRIMVGQKIIYILKKKPKNKIERERGKRSDYCTRLLKLFKKKIKISTLTVVKKERKKKNSNF